LPLKKEWNSDRGQDSGDEVQTITGKSHRESMTFTKERQLHRLYQAIQGDSRYRNERMGTIFVPGVGDTHASVVFIGEAPGREEELQGMPFVGAAGGNLNTLLDHVCWARDRLFITNLIKYRPFSETGANRKPSLKESRYALSYLLRELAIVNPPWVVCLGSSAASVLLGQAGLKMSDISGKIRTWDSRKLFVTYHPSPLNYNNPQRKHHLVRDFEYLKSLLPVS
jgi:uracil-DNA glycosylase